MNEIDIFLELLDDNDLYHICKKMKIPAQAKNNKELSKIRLRQKFKSGNKSFNSFIIQNLDEDIGKLTENEYLIFLRYVSSLGYSNHKKFINLLGHFPKKAEELLGNISSNLNSDRHLYEFDILFDDKDIENLFNKAFKFLDKEEIINNIDSIFKFIFEEKIIDKSSIENIDIRNIKEYTLKDLFKNMENISQQEDLLNKYFYIKSHEIEEPLYSHLLLNIYMHFSAILEPNIRKSNNSKDNTNLIFENGKLREDNEEFKRKIKGYEHQEKQLKRNIAENNKLKDIMNDKQKQINRYKYELDDLELEYQTLLENQGTTRRIINDYEERVNDLNLYLENLNFDLSDTNIVVVTNYNRKRLESLYEDEVVFLSSNEVNKNKSLKLHKKVNAVLIERNGITSHAIRSIKNQFINCSVIIKIINPRNDKELLEEIIITKDKIRRKFKI